MRTPKRWLQDWLGISVIATRIVAIELRVEPDDWLEDLSPVEPLLPTVRTMTPEEIEKFSGQPLAASIKKGYGN